MEELLNPDCLPPDESVCFGYNLSHTSMGNAKALIEHFKAVGFLEFKKVWTAGKIRDPLEKDERWHMLRPEASDTETMDCDPEGTPHENATRSKKSTPVKPPQFGSGGPLLPVTIADPALLSIVVRDSDFQAVDDPPHAVAIDMPLRDPADPAWCPPCAVPSNAWARGQYVYHVVREIGGAEMQAILKASVALVQCPVSIMVSPLSKSMLSPTINS